MNTAFWPLAAAGGHAPPPLVDIDGTVFLQFGIFIVLLFVLTKLVFKPYLALLRERSANIEGAREQARGMDAEHDKALASYEDQILKARKEAAGVRAELRTDGERQASEVLGKARGEAEAKLQASRERMEKSAQAAQLALRTRVDHIARDITSKLLGREV